MEHKSDKTNDQTQQQTAVFFDTQMFEVEVEVRKDGFAIASSVKERALTRQTNALEIRLLTIMSPTTRAFFESKISAKFAAWNETSAYWEMKPGAQKCSLYEADWSLTKTAGLCRTMMPSSS